MNLDICFKAISVLQNNLQTVENVCNICGGKHYTQNCPDLTRGKHVHDTPQQNMSRSSAPSGIYIIETNDGTRVVTSQKFAKGCRFGPLLAEKSYMPLENTKFPLIIFQNPVYNNDDPEFENLFSIRNFYLDTNNENMCNWMIHVTPAKYSNEQNLMCFQLHNQIYYTAIQDIDVGDILKVWYAPNYASKMNTELLQTSPYEINNNIRQVSISTYDTIVEDSISQFPNNKNDNKITEVSLPPINSLMRLSSQDFSFETNNNLYSSYQNYNPESPQQIYDTTVANTSLCSFSVGTDDLNNLFMNSCSELFNCSFESSFASDFDDGFDTVFPSHNLNVIQHTSTPNKTKKNKNGNGNRLRPATYYCKICNKSYVAICNLYKHMQQHDLYLCSLCMKSFETLDILKDHNCPNKSSNSEDSTCSVCFKVLSNSWSLARHAKKCINKDLPLSENNNSSMEKKLIETNNNNSDLFYEDLENLPEENSFLDNENSFDQTKINIAKESIPPLVKISPESDSTLSSIDIISVRTPVKPSVARALASKLNQKKAINNVIDHEHNSQINFDQNGLIMNVKSKKKIRQEENDEMQLMDVNNSVNKNKKTKIKKVSVNRNTTETLRPFSCNICNKAYAKKDGLLKHKITHENRHFICTFCSHSPLKSSDSLRRHLKANHLDQQEIWRKKGFINSFIIKDPDFIKKQIKIEDSMDMTTIIKMEPIDDEDKTTQNQNNIIENNIETDVYRKIDFYNKKINNNVCPKDYDNIKKNKVPKNTKKSNCDSLKAKNRTKSFISTKVTNKQQNLLKQFRTNNNNNINLNNKLTSTVQNNNMLINNDLLICPKMENCNIHQIESPFIHVVHEKSIIQNGSNVTIV